MTSMNSARGRKMRRQKGARAAHRSIRKQGRVPGEEARAALHRQRMARRNLAEFLSHYDLDIDVDAVERITHTMEEY
jgi:hypothetical protein